MTLNPQKLQKGWFLRCLVSGCRLSARSPLLWLVLYVCVPILTFYFPYLPIATFFAGLILIFGTMLCFASDHLSKYKFIDFISLILLKPQILILLGTSCVLSVLLFKTSFFLDVKSPLQMLFTFSVGFLNLFVSMLFSSIAVLTLYDIPVGLWKLYKKGDDDIDHTISGSFSVFALHLMIDTRLDWHSACELSRKGVDLLSNREKLIMLPMLNLGIFFPPSVGIVLPFFYAIYRELYWGKGITEREKAKVLAHA